MVGACGRLEKRRTASRTNPVVQLNDYGIDTIYPLLTIRIKQLDLGTLDV